jgi:hypothetical protein
VGVALTVLFFAAVGVASVHDGVQSLTRPTHCGRQVMSAVDGCEVIDLGGRNHSKSYTYWPGGRMAGIARSIPADWHLQSRDQMRHSEREDGIGLLVVGCGALALAAFLAWILVRAWWRTRPNVR